MTNIIFKVVVVDKPCEPLLLRAYGNCTDIFMNREAEINYFKILSDNNFGVRLIKVFPGGRLEAWREGYNPLLAPEMRSEAISMQIAKTLAVMHNIKVQSPAFPHRS
ncbi:uncharacterized protein [Blastocystis hominis]|uniref:Aminoglycoside phosphotransferase domain-containing protein n=1 Tax=Blastocystis hominis TaxID=12968 RepID=D8M798_BLAHO|nr:uncharacterized protein [Blastocystis hominis]CBK23937.2 unnamed protein product [Blastocystis hominis]|eukprot:XP_012897985.1 uncharacterized protein [Blastocystis hominis]